MPLSPLTYFCLTDDVRNDLYVTLLSADFERGNKSADRNVEVRVLVINHNGETIQV